MNYVNYKLCKLCKAEFDAGSNLVIVKHLIHIPKGAEIVLIS